MEWYEKGALRLCCIKWDTLKVTKEIVDRDGSLNGEGKGTQQLYNKDLLAAPLALFGHHGNDSRLAI